MSADMLRNGYECTSKGALLNYRKKLEEKQDSLGWTFALVDVAGKEKLATVNKIIDWYTYFSGNILELTSEDLKALQDEEFFSVMRRFVSIKFEFEKFKEKLILHSDALKKTGTAVDLKLAQNIEKFISDLETSRTAQPSTECRLM